MSTVVVTNSGTITVDVNTASYSNQVLASVATIAALRLLSGTNNGDIVSVAGYASQDDGGGGMFVWNSTSTVADNGGTIIAPTGVSTGRWYRLYSGEVSVQWFGAKCDGTTDDSSAFQSAVDSNKGGAVYIPPNTTCVAAGILLSGSTYNNTKIHCYGTFMLKADGGSTNFGGAWVGIIVQSCDEVEINGIFNGNRSSMTATEHIYCVGLAGATHYKSQFLEFLEIRGDGIYIGQSNWTSSSTNSSDVEIGTIFAHNSADDGRNAVTVIACSRLLLNSLYSYQIGGTINSVIMPGGIDFEPDFSYETISDVTIGNIFVVSAGNSGVEVLGIAITNDATRDWNINRLSFGNVNLTLTGLSTSQSIISRCADISMSMYLTGGKGYSLDYIDRSNLKLKSYNTASILQVGSVGDIRDFQIDIQSSKYSSTANGIFVRGATRGLFTGRIGGSTGSGVTPIQLNTLGSAYTQADVIYSISNPYDGNGTPAFYNGGANAVGATNCSIQDCDFSGYAGAAITDATMIRINVRGVTDGTSSNPTTTSGTVYQNTSFMWITLLVPVTFTPTSGAAATCAVALGSTNTPSTISTETVPLGTALDSFIRTIPLRVPPNWYYKFTVTNATIGTVTQISG